MERLKAPLSREQEGKAPFISRNTTYRKTYGWWTPEDFSTETKGSWKSASKSCLEGKLYFKSVIFSLKLSDVPLESR